MDNNKKLDDVYNIDDEENTIDLEQDEDDPVELDFSHEYDR